ncbi:guanylate kinase [Morococcus cerebrosus]|uniref:Guanylate kinase n=1 Tax=Morococcus cerebrosus TaxID=1056807 RepID=A0A0C1EAI5_9NEIS|nr:guanylate kinase [Morococcus cerebrosus]
MFNLKPFSDDLLSGLESRRVEFKSGLAVPCRMDLNLTHTLQNKTGGLDGRPLDCPVVYLMIWFSSPLA